MKNATEYAEFEPVPDFFKEKKSRIQYMETTKSEQLQSIDKIELVHQKMQNRVVFIIFSNDFDKLGFGGKI